MTEIWRYDGVMTEIWRYVGVMTDIYNDCISFFGPMVQGNHGFIMVKGQSLNQDTYVV